MRLKILVVDDEALAREGLKLLLSHQPHVECVSEARNGREAIALIREQKPDLVLLDVQMPRTDGFAVVHSIGAERMPPVIFVTAHDQYAIRAFEIAAIDYVLKPVTEERFALAFKRAVGRLQGVNYVRLHTGSVTHLMHVPMNTIEAVLDSNHFLRVHRSHIVNVRRIAQLWSITHGQYVIELISGHRLQSGRTYSERIRRALTNPF